MTESIIVRSDTLVSLAAKMTLEFTLALHSDVAVAAGLGTFTGPLFLELMLPALDVGFSGRKRVQEHAAQFTLVLIGLAASGVSLSDSRRFAMSQSMRRTRSSKISPTR